MNQENSTKHVLEGRELIDYLVEKASSTTNAELLQREDRRNRRASILMAMVGAIGIGGVIGALKLFVKEEMERVEKHMTSVAAELESYVDSKAQQFEKEMSVQVDSIVKQQVEQQVGQVRTLLEQYKSYQELLAQSEIIQDELAEDKVPDSSIENAVKLLADLALAETIVSQPRFLEATNIVIDLLVRMDRHSDIDVLDKLLGTVFVTHKDISLNLTDHYGQVIISSPYPVEKLSTEFDALTRYAQASREMRYPEKALMWELFVAYKRNGYQRNPTTDVMVETVQDLNDDDTRNLCYHMFRNSHPLHWMNRPDQEGRELARLVTSLLDNYPNMRQLVETQIRIGKLRPMIENLITNKLEREKVLQAEAAAQAVQETAGREDGEEQLRR